MEPLFVRVHNQPLSLWQSAVAEEVRKGLLLPTATVVSTNQWLDHPLVQATNTYAALSVENPQFEMARLAAAGPSNNLVYLSQLGHQIGIAKAEGDEARAEALLTTYRQYSDRDPGFLSCAVTYAEYYHISKGQMQYNDWTVAGNNNLDYGVIEYQLPNDAVIGVVGDWGTGLADAKALLLDLMQQHKPTVIIHLGDIYYSGTPGECQNTFSAIFDDVFDQVLGQGNRIPVFTLPGNHDYYAWGMGFYPMLTQINSSLPTAEQVASYFCLRTEDNGWQFLGMDTGYHDSNPGDQISPTYAGPWLQPTEILWHRDKVENFSGATILLSHHQLFSAHGKLNGSLSAYRDVPYFNPFLYEVFYDFLSTKIAGWFWGHEHNLVLYQNNLFGLAKGRLVGCSAYEELTSATPYAVTYPEIPYLLTPPQGQLHSNADPNGIAYYNHGYAVIDVGGRAQPTDPVTINYYEFPSWGTQAPPQPASQTVYSEQLSMPANVPQPVVQSGDSLYMRGQEGLYVSALHQAIQYYPTLNPSGPVALNIIRQAGPGSLTDGDTVFIQTTESAAGQSNRLGAWSTPALYYYSPGYAQQQWTVKKQNATADPTIHYSDQVYFVNQSYSGQVLCSYFSVIHNSVYLTTKANITYYWSMQPGIITPLPQQFAVSADQAFEATSYGR